MESKSAINKYNPNKTIVFKEIQSKFNTNNHTSKITSNIINIQIYIFVKHQHPNQYEKQQHIKKNIYKQCYYLNIRRCQS